MSDIAAFKAAIDLMCVPSRVRRFRAKPLPEGMILLLQVAAGDRQAEAEAIALTGRPSALIRDAAYFFIEQILLSPDADCYRLLGAQSNASPAELRRHMVLLLKGLHPDITADDRSLFARRITAAWDQLKTAERRAAYDARQSHNADKPPHKKRTRSGSSQNQSFALPCSRPERATAIAPCREDDDGVLRRTLRLLMTGERS